MPVTNGCMPEKVRPTINDYNIASYKVKAYDKITIKLIESMAATVENQVLCIGEGWKEVVKHNKWHIFFGDAASFHIFYTHFALEIAASSEFDI